MTRTNLRWSSGALPVVAVARCRAIEGRGRAGNSAEALKPTTVGFAPICERSFQRCAIEPDDSGCRMLTGCSQICNADAKQHVMPRLCHEHGQVYACPSTHTYTHTHANTLATSPCLLRTPHAQAQTSPSSSTPRFRPSPSSAASTTRSSPQARRRQRRHPGAERRAHPRRRTKCERRSARHPGGVAGPPAEGPGTTHAGEPSAHVCFCPACCTIRMLHMSFWPEHVRL